MNIIPWTRRRHPPATHHDFDDLWRSVFNGGWQPRHLPEAFHGASFPHVNLAETEGAFEVTVELAGMDEKDIDVQLLGNVLVISGERTWKDEKTAKEYHRVESEFGSFRREVALPEGLRLAPDEVKARYKKGVLRVVVPKAEPTLASRITVEAKD